MPKGVARDPARANQWRIAARRIGVTLDEYTQARAANLRWCWACRRFRELHRFGADKCRKGGGIDGTCIECRQSGDVNRPRARQTTEEHHHV
jgi:hypothetical protein